MKTNFLTLALIFTCFTQIAFGQIRTDTITAEEASQLIGEQVTIRAKVASVFYAKSSGGSPTFMYDFEGGFYLEDEYGFSLISKGVHQYVGSERKFTVREIIKYGYTDKKLMALVVDTTNKKYFIECLKNNDIKSKQDMIINVLDENAHINLEEYKWIEIKDGYFKRIELIRDYILISLILLSFLTIYLRFKTRK